MSDFSIPKEIAETLVHLKMQLKLLNLQDEDASLLCGTFMAMILDGTPPELAMGAAESFKLWQPTFYKYSLLTVDD